MAENVNIEEDKLKKILCDNLNMLFEKLEHQNRELNKIDLKLDLNGGNKRKEKKK